LADDALPSLSKTFVDLAADVEVVPGRRRRGARRPVRDLRESRGKRFTESSVLESADASATIRYLDWGWC
jgi:hypothetical protein